ncbi:MAG: hypothetical protein PHT60_09400 [Acidiphilium sp.]|nr:hypothetical protein [Acidiphilium sp.]MDD4935978.1 hypothetical protein [Acidiphilium sp.]
MENALDRSFTADVLNDVITPGAALGRDFHAGAAYRAHRAVAACA